MKHRPRQFGAESFRALWCMEGKFCSRLFWMRSSEPTFEHEHQNGNDDHHNAQDAQEERRPGHRSINSGWSAGETAGTGTSTAHATPGTRTAPIPLPLVPRGRGSASCLRVQGPRVDRVGCPVSSGPSRAVSTCPGAACPACRVSGVLRSIAGRVRVSRSRRSHGRGRACGVPVAAHREEEHTQGICWADHRQSRGQMPVNGYKCQGCLRPIRRRRRRPGWPGLSLGVQIRS